MARGGVGGSGIVIVRIRRAAEDVEPVALKDGEATGGDAYLRSRGFGIHTFTTNGTFTLARDATVDLLLVGGGAGGGAGRGGGGGAGGVAVYTNIALSAGAYDIVVGRGGAGGVAAAAATNGTGSSVRFGQDFVVSVPGGGAGGGGYECVGTHTGSDGASGGGGGLAVYWENMGTAAGGRGVPYCGHNGGCSTNAADHYRTFGGGGGGAGGRGADAVWNGGSTGYGAGKGGDGLWCDFSGAPVCYGGGGGGGNGGRPAGVNVSGGSGGGGAGGRGDVVIEGVTSATPGEAGANGSGGGGGGGGGYTYTYAAGGAGGSGIVILRYHLEKNGLMLSVR